MTQTLREFFEDSEIFVTGGSGVVGKALIEKLLRSTNVRRIYVLLRSRGQLNAEQRLAKLRDAKVFQVLRAQKPQELNKLIAIPGDVSLPQLGIDPNHLKQLDQVSIVFHCAATVRFDEPLRVALQLNVGGTLEALKFAEQLRHLRIFVHVSTFFSNPYLKRVEPKWYGSPMDWRLCLRLLDEIKDDNILDTLTRKLIVGFPNTYTFTKNLAESLINDYRTRLPVIVYRPSIVLFAVREPLPGFAPSLMGAMGLFSLVGAGLLKTVYIRRSVYLDITPQDMGIIGMIYYTKCGYEAYREGTPKELLIYQTSSKTHIPYTFIQMASHMDIKNLWYSAAFLKNLGVPGCHYTENRFVYKFLFITKQLLPAILVDLLLRLFGRPPALLAIQRKLYHTLEVMKPFLFNNYDSPGVTDFKGMIKEIKGTEFDISYEYESAHDKERLTIACKNMIQSIRHDLLNEDPSTLARAQMIMRIKNAIYNALRLYLLYKLLRWLWFHFLG
ncbi:PREDICTED: fatty acyl-CoA reductase 1 [Drosophila arizonae]|uniref:Fatty acyl-CoA reductase n=1 Tax=Drosophila arizonae TaxID=7263 RepID=A0ABM1PVK6_DROAR|nr:PREDICTED: fatty acyl-CoA reductase 1 [Drosophila arizonae]